MNQNRVVAFGEILFDQFVDEGYENLGGAPFNFAFHIQKLIQQVVLISAVGTDPRGQRVREFLNQRLFPAEFIQASTEYPTGLVKIALTRKGIPDYTIMPEVAYDHIQLTDALQTAINSKSVDLIYFGTLGQRGEVSRDTLKFLLDHSHAPYRMYDINLRKDTYDQAVVENSLQACNVLKINDDELMELNDWFVLGTSLKDMAKALQVRYEIPIICVTLGAKGSMLLMNDSVYLKMITPESVKDTVGAGDSFAAVLAIGLIQNWQGPVILDLASEMAGLVCQQEGAIPRDDLFYAKIKESISKIG